MAIDPRIALGAQASNIGDLVMNFANDMERTQQLEKQNERQDKLFGLQEKQLEAQTTAAQRKAAEASRKRSVEDAMRLTAKLAEVKDPNARLQLLKGHRQHLQQRINSGEIGVTTTDTDQMLQQLQSAPDQFEQNLAGEVAAYERLGKYQPAPETFTTETVNGVPVQVSSKTGRRVADPTHKKPNVLEGIAGLLGRDKVEQSKLKIEAQELANDKARREAEAAEKSLTTDKLNKLRTAKDAIEVSMPQLSDVDESVDNAIRLAEQWQATGTTGEILKNAAGTAATDLRAELETIGSVVTLSALADAKAGGVSFGALSEGEIKIVGAGAGNLSPKQSSAQLIRNLKRIKARNARIRGKLNKELGRVYKDLKIEPEGEATPEEQILANPPPSAQPQQIQSGRFTVTISE